MVELNETFFIQLVNFLIMVFFLNHFLFRPVMAVVEKRKKRLDSLETDVGGLKEKAEKIVADYEKQLSDIKKETAEIIGKARLEAQEEQNRVVSEARSQFSRQVEDGRLQIRREAEAASSAIKKEAENISGRIASKLLGAEV
jgi:F-type H+-transporting ATPase subunit b